jgi:DUF1016 N-terminal domain
MSYGPEKSKNMNRDEESRRVSCSLLSSVSPRRDIGKLIVESDRRGSGPIVGKQGIMARLSRQLVAEYGRGYTEKNLCQMIQFAGPFLKEIIATLRRQLSWSRFRELSPLNLARSAERQSRPRRSKSRALSLAHEG